MSAAFRSKVPATSRRRYDTTAATAATGSVPADYTPKRIDAATGNAKTAERYGYTDVALSGDGTPLSGINPSTGQRETFVGGLPKVAADNMRASGQPLPSPNGGPVSSARLILDAAPDARAKLDNPAGAPIPAPPRVSFPGFIKNIAQDAVSAGRFAAGLPASTPADPSAPRQFFTQQGANIIAGDPAAAAVTMETDELGNTHQAVDAAGNGLYKARVTNPALQLDDGQVYRQSVDEYGNQHHFRLLDGEAGQDFHISPQDGTQYVTVAGSDGTSRRVVLGTDQSVVARNNVDGLVRTHRADAQAAEADRDAAEHGAAGARGGASQPLASLRRLHDQYAGVLNGAQDTVDQANAVLAQGGTLTGEQNQTLTRALGALAEHGPAANALLDQIQAREGAHDDAQQRVDASHRQMRDAQAFRDTLGTPEGKVAVPDKKRVFIFTPAQASALLAAADAQIRPYLALCCFAGLRPEHAQGVKGFRWEMIHLDRGEHSEIEVPASTDKTEGERIVPVQSNLRAWLLATPEEARRGTVRYSRRLRRLAYEALRAQFPALPPTWPQDGPRHSFASYRVKTTGSFGTVAQEMGNSESVVRDKYYRSISDKDAAAYWNIYPEELLPT